MTADELLAMSHNDYRYELVQGALRQMEFADRQHGRIAAQIGSCLEADAVLQTYTVPRDRLFVVCPQAEHLNDFFFL